MTTGLLSIFALLSLVVLLRALRLDLKNLVYASKPLAMVSIALIAYFTWPVVSPAYQYLLLAGFAFSLAGDALLMLPSDRFVSGLAAFLAAHLAYVAAFLSRLESVPLLPLLPYAVATLFVLRLLWPHLGSLRVPVVLYALMLAGMAGLAWGVAQEVGGWSAWLAAAGAALFVISDAALAFNRFVGQFGAANTVILSTYFLAQWLLALSVAA